MPSTTFGAITGSTNSAPGAASSLRIQPTSGPSPPLLIGKIPEVSGQATVPGGALCTSVLAVTGVAVAVPAPPPGAKPARVVPEAPVPQIITRLSTSSPRALKQQPAMKRPAEGLA